MNSIEIKHNLIRKIDSLNDSDLEKVYQQLLDILKIASPYQLTEEENIAIDEALKVSEKGEVYSHDEVMNESKTKYPNLKFK